MHFRSRTALAAIVSLACLAASVQATTIGFVGAAGVNQDIPANYGSNIATSSDGWTTADGTGATPHIGLNWGNGTRWDWEFHSANTFDAIEGLHAGGAWDAVAPGTAVAQLQSDQPNGRLELNFSVLPGVKLVLNSLDIGNASDQTAADGPYGFDITLIRDSDGATVWSHTTPQWDVEPDPPSSPRTPREQSVAINYTGDLGEDYTLAFTRQGFGNGATFRSGLDNLSFSEIQTPAAPQFKLLVDRSTGALSLKNFGATAQTIKGYSIVSETGALNQSAWKTISGNYDASGNGSVDANDDWTKLSQTGDSTDFSEFEFGGNGGTIAAGAEVVLNKAGQDAWFRSPYEDLTLELALDDGNVYEFDVEYTGSYQLGDLNFDGAVNLLDWPAYHAGRGVDMTGMTAVEAYQLGDLNGDRKNDLADFVLFKQLVVSASIAADATAIPEPASIALLLAACGLLCVRRSVQSRLDCTLASLRRIPVKRPIAIVAGMFVCCASLTSSTQATTIGFVGAANVNQDIPVNYGSNISADGAGWTISDGTGATPNVALYWGGSPDGTGWDWEFHNAGTFNSLENLHTGGAWDGGSSNAVVQLQSQVAAGRHEINFAPTSGTKFVLNSFDIGNATDQTAAEGPYGFDIALIRDSDASTVWTHSTPEFGPGQQESVPVNYTGGAGESYTLSFTRYGQGDPNITWRSGLDNLSFSEGFDVAPLKLVVSTTTGLVQIKNESAASFTIDSYKITSESASLDPTGWHSLEDSDYEGNGAPGDGNGWEEAPGSNASQLIEDFLQGSTTIAGGTTISLGQAFDFNKSGVQQDLVFGYHVVDTGEFYTIGDSEYVSPVVDADFDNNGKVDGRDFLVWQRGFGLTGGSATNANGNADGDADVDGDDLAVWEIKFGSATPAIGTVPEPSAVCLWAIAGMIFWGASRRGANTASGGTATRRKLRSMIGLALACCVTLVAPAAEAATTIDRRYEFGDGGSGNLQDSQFISTDDRQDLSTVVGAGSPVFVNVSSTGLNRPGAVSGDKGAQFDGNDDVLSGVPLNRPDETGGPGFVGLGPLLYPFPYNYDRITTRGLQMWVYPDAAAIGTGRQGIVFDTQAAGGVSITADGKWTQSFAGSVTDGSIEATVPVVGNQWYHVMHHVYGSTQEGFPEPLSNGRAFTGVVYVNGIAVSASNGTVYAGQLDDGNRVGVLAVGAEELSNDGFDPLFGNHFKGVVDDLQMYVYGDNSSEFGPPAGQDYGTFNLFADNSWIAAQVAAIPGGTLQLGDVNRDGSVNQADVTAFVSGWQKEKKFRGALNEMFVGDWETWGWGDLNLDGRVNLTDAVILDENLVVNGVAAGLDFSLLNGAAVPEPGAFASCLLLTLTGLVLRKKKAACLY